MNDTEYYESCKNIIDVLKEETATDYQSWFAVGSALYTVLGGSQEGLELFLQFSKKSTKYDEEECTQLWEKGMSGYTYGTLMFYFQRDNVSIKRW